ncbi:MAG: metallophosphoesterase [Deltaproteobacteria bacterium]|nr:metallophosphoesterase [Deltaproteobacteria bacterium]
MSTSPTWRPVRVLHLSDLHFSAKTAWDSGTVLGRLAADVARLRAEVGELHLVVVTGDIANFGTAEEYAQATAWLTGPLATAAGVTPAQIRVVPGNHDVHRGSITRTAKALTNGLSRPRPQQAIAEVLSTPTSAPRSSPARPPTSASPRPSTPASPPLVVRAPPRPSGPHRPPRGLQLRLALGLGRRPRQPRPEPLAMQRAAQRGGGRRPHHRAAAPPLGLPPRARPSVRRGDPPPLRRHPQRPPPPAEGPPRQRPRPRRAPARRRGLLRGLQVGERLPAPRARPHARRGPRPLPPLGRPRLDPRPQPLPEGPRRRGDPAAAPVPTSAAARSRADARPVRRHKARRLSLAPLRVSRRGA